MMTRELKNIIEAVLMVSDTPLSVAKIQGVFDDASVPRADEVQQVIAELQKDCAQRALELRQIGNGYRYQTKIKYADWIRKLQAGRPPRLSRALLETLAIIAYRQPVSRGDIEEIRGVAVSAEIMQRLIERNWVKQVGVRDTPGRPALFATTPAFLGYFNLQSLGELPPLMHQRELGDIAKELETPPPSEVLTTWIVEQEGNENQIDIPGLRPGDGHEQRGTPEHHQAETAETEILESDVTH